MERRYVLREIRNLFGVYKTTVDPTEKEISEEDIMCLVDEYNETHDDMISLEAEGIILD